MTTQEKQMITSLSENGLGYRKIAAQIGISENTVKSYLKRMTAADDQKEPDQPAAVFSCPQCGMEIYQQPGRKAKRFCSDSCRYKWWNSHPPQSVPFLPVCLSLPFRPLGSVPGSIRPAITKSPHVSPVVISLHLSMSKIYRVSQTA